MSSYDLHQFANRRQQPVEAYYGADHEWHSTGLSFDDYERAHVETHKGNLPSVPPFALNPDQLRKVLIMRAFRYVHSGNTPVPENVDWKAIDQAATEKALRGYTIRADASRIQHEMQERHKQAIRRAGSYLALQSSIAYSSWQLGRDSVAVATDLGIDPCNVRATLERIRMIARRLGFEVGVDRRSVKRKLREDERAAQLKAKPQKPATKPPRAPVLCTECGQPCPVGTPRKFCNARCRKASSKRRAAEKRRLRFCSMECRNKAKGRSSVGGFDFGFQFSTSTERREALIRAGLHC